jgi:hypothetical protein
MSVTFAPIKVSIPNGIDVLLADLSREVLRNNPQNIYAFAAEFFKARIGSNPGNK